MKKTIAILLSAALMLSTAALAGCSGGGGDTSGNSSSGAVEETKAEANTQTLTIDNHAGMVMTLEYPDSFTYNADYIGDNPLGQNLESRCGALEGEYTVAFYYSALSYYDDFSSYVSQFKSNPIYEELDLDGHKTYVRQYGDSILYFIITYSDTEFICMTVDKDGAETEQYKEIYESETMQSMINSIRFEGGQAAEALTTENGYLTITPTTGWYEGESKSSHSLTLYNDKISSVTYVNIEDYQLSTVDQLKEYTLAGYSSYSFETKTIGGNSFEVLDADSVSYVIAESSTGKGIEIELRNCTLEEANDLLETIVIK